jgi:hypothetical protein
MKRRRFSVVAVTMLLLSPVSSGQTAQSGQNCPTIIVQAKNFSRGSGIEIETGGHPEWGLNTIHNAPPYEPAVNLAEYNFNACARAYRLDVEYAAAESRPVEIYINGKLAIPNGLQATTGGWSDARQRWLSQGEVRLTRGSNTLQFKRNNYFPHIRTFRLVPLE